MGLIRHLNNMNNDSDGPVIDGLLDAVTDMLKVVTLLQGNERLK
jgi:hypothetical protein